MLSFIKFLGHKKWLIIIIFVFLIGQVCFDLMLPVFMGNIISSITEHSQNINVSEIIFGALKMFGAAIGSCICVVLSGIVTSYVTSKMAAQIRYDLYDKIMLFSAYEKGDFNSATLVTRITSDVNNIATAYVYIFRFGIYGPLSTISAFIFLLINNFKYQLAFLVAGAFIILGLLVFIILRIAMPHFNAIQPQVDKINLLTKENLEGLRVIRAYNAEAYHQDKFNKYAKNLMRDDRIANRCLAFLNPLIQLCAGFILVGITLISCYLIENNTFDFSQMTVVIQYSISLLAGFVNLVFVVITVPRLSISSKRVKEILDIKIRVEDNLTSPNTNKKGVVEFKDVSFTYPGGTSPSIKNVSFKVNQGETIAFIGATGSGKSTIINLILRSYDASNGSIFVDDIDVKKYHLDDLFRRFGYVPQKPYLFHETLRHNVFIGNPKANNSDYLEAIEVSQSKEFINKLENGENYEISQGGKNVSGGQRQRLSIARALIKKPEIFIFDDSFSALDYHTDKTIRADIRSRYKGTTNIIVAQRVGTIMDADQIIVLDKGSIVGKGTHYELLKNCKIYREIALSQLSEKELLNA